MTPSAWIAAFAALYAAFDLAPSFLTRDVGHRLTSGDLLSFFMPLGVLPPLWQVRMALAPGLGHVRARTVGTTMLLVAVVLIADGHGMNLAANAVARQLHGQEHTGAWVLDYFFDEDIGHVLGHGGLLLATYALLLMADGLVSPRTDRLALATAPLLGFAYFADGVEGQTVGLLLPGAVIGAAWALAGARRAALPLGRQSVRVFLLVVYLTALALFAVWGVWQGGFPEFSALGWI